MGVTLRSELSPPSPHLPPPPPPPPLSLFARMELSCGVGGRASQTAAATAALPPPAPPPPGPGLLMDGEGPGEEDYESLPTGASLYTHMTAGAVAGILEHTVMYPVDSVKVSGSRGGRGRCWGGGGRGCPFFHSSAGIAGSGRIASPVPSPRLASSEERGERLRASSALQGKCACYLLLPSRGKKHAAS